MPYHRKKNQLGRFVKNDAAEGAELQRTFVDKRGKPRFYRLREKRMVVVHHFKVDRVLGPQDRVAYERLLCDPNSTAASLHAWLKEHATGPVSRDSVRRHRRHFTAGLNQIRESVKLASGYIRVIEQADPAILARATVARYEQLLMTSLFKMEEDQQMAADEWRTLSQTIKDLTDSRAKLGRVNNSSSGAARESAEAKTRRLEQEKEERQQAAADAGPALVARMRRILGMEGEEGEGSTEY